MREPQHSTHCSVQNQRVDEVAIFHKIYNCCGFRTTEPTTGADGRAMPMVPGPPTASTGVGSCYRKRMGGQGTCADTAGQPGSFTGRSNLLYRIGYLLRRECERCRTGVRVRAESSPSCNTVQS